MATIYDYLKWRGDVPFSVDPFNEVDNLVLAELSYTFFQGFVPTDRKTVTLKNVQKSYFETHSREEAAEASNPIYRTPLLMDGMVSGARFGKTKLSDYVDIVDENQVLQMSAVTFLLSDGTAYIAFRGTDNTIVGWKEDFNMSFQTETVGQRKAVEYLDTVGSRIRRPLRVGGHSKGGNFAIYASAFCKDKVRKKIIEVYSNDGPGFRDEVMEDEAYKRVLPKIISTVPDTSIIGMLLTNELNHNVVKSEQSGFQQHDGQTWQVERNRFVRAELSDTAKFIRSIQKDWLSKLDDASRESFVNTLFEMFEATGAHTFGEISINKAKSLEHIVSYVKEMPRETQSQFTHVIGEFLYSGGQTTLSALTEAITEVINPHKSS